MQENFSSGQLSVSLYHVINGGKREIDACNYHIFIFVLGHKGRIQEDLYMELISVFLYMRIWACN